MKRGLDETSYMVSMGTLMCPRASPDGVLSTEPAPSKNLPIERKKRFCIVLTPPGVSAPVASGAVSKVIRKKYLDIV
jgi:hypothetical protein